jgi:hypothetical protein
MDTEKRRPKKKSALPVPVQKALTGIKLKGSARGVDYF